MDWSSSSFEFFGFAAMVSPLFSFSPTLPYQALFPFLSLTYSMSVSKMRAFDPASGILGCGGTFYMMHQEPIFNLS